MSRCSNPTISKGPFSWDSTSRKPSLAGADLECGFDSKENEMVSLLFLLALFLTRDRGRISDEPFRPQ